MKSKLFFTTVLGVLQVFIGITAILGGFGLVSDPSGSKMDLPLALLENSPFTDYLIPGLVLFIVIGIGNISAGITTFLRHRNCGKISLLFGGFLALYMIIEVGFIGFQNFSQPLYFILGFFESFLGLKLSKLNKTEPQIWVEKIASRLTA